MRRFAFSLRALLLVVALVGGGLATWHAATAGSRNRQRLIDELENVRRPLTFQLDQSEPEALASRLYFKSELPFNNQRGEPRSVLIFDRGMSSFPGFNPKLIVLANLRYQVLCSLSYTDGNADAVMLATVSSDSSTPTLHVTAIGWGSGSTTRTFALDDDHIQPTAMIP